MIEVKKLCKSFDAHKAVNDLTFQVRPGEVLGFLGPNGAGKTTTMRMIAGFIEPDSGGVSIFGNDVLESPMKTKAMIGYLPEGAPAYAEMTVRKFLEFIADVRGMSGARRSERIEAVVERLQLQNVKNQKVETLSKGYKRRVGLAQALLDDPRVLILDEPTDGLDPNQKFEVRSLIREISQDKIVIISTHILEEVDALCERVIIISGGELVADGTPAELRMTSKYHRAVEIEIANPENILKLFQASDELGNAYVSEDNAQRLIVEPLEGEDCLQQVQALIENNQLEVRSVGISGGRLDDVFRRVTTG